ncbi:extracellular solute-binding protein [Siccirubricoccus sp. KC 17139]|uniref:Extracellular solute-binding protein n=1 Tax=Siccirubricoccus soli TaxID=2899147 RepID=A0ABT1CY60_9PROT|nr:extracellular solute-binding protein [Siccirubricoccus soli]MCO6414594.1 extracellular solute-binding protein [Siccirubricoccus soli]MCP2680724.1 extracellular solute-binding protein [Siccirubricoccus soli]
MSLARRALLLAPLAAPAIASAQTGELVVGTWGGDYAALLASEIEQPLLRPRGLLPVHEVGTPAARKTRLIAERSSRRASMDVVCLGDADTHAIGQMGLLEELTPEKVPNLAKVIPALRYPYTLPHIYSVRAILSNPARMDPAPTRYDQLFVEGLRNRIGFSDLLFTHITESAAIAAGGDEGNHRPGRGKLLEWKRLGARVYPSNEVLAAALKSEEVWATIIWLGRAYMWRKAGIPVVARIPEEGATPYISCACVPKNARNKEAAFAYLDAMLDPRAALGFAERMGFLPTTTDATLPLALQAEIGLTAEQQAKLRRQDFDYLARTNAETLDFWNREFKG